MQPETLPAYRAAWLREKGLWWVARTNCKTEAKWSRERRESVARPPKVPRLPIARLLPRPPGDPLDESVAAVHFAAGCHHPPDGWRAARGVRSLPAVAGFRAAASRLPNNPGPDVLSRWKPRGHGVVGDRTARTELWANPGPLADDFDQFVRQLAGYAAIQFGLEYRCGREERKRKNQGAPHPPPKGPAEPADLQQD